VREDLRSCPRPRALRCLGSKSFATCRGRAALPRPRVQEARELTLAKPAELQWRIEEPPWGGRQEKALFTTDAPCQYDFHVTDLTIEEALHSLGLGVHPRDAIGIDDDADVYLTISLGEPHNRNDDCYKLAAAVIPVE
jgi:hypothetical protein